MKEKSSTKRRLLPAIDLGRRNIKFFLIGLAVLIAGYILLSIAPWNNPLSRTLAPLVLLAGYLVIFPIALMVKSGSKPETPGEPKGSQKKN
jgi:hypothetical protein